MAANTTAVNTSFTKYNNLSKNSLSNMNINLITNPIGKVSTIISKILFNCGHISIGNKKGQISAANPNHINQYPIVFPNAPKNLFKSIPLTESILVYYNISILIV